MLVCWEGGRLGFFDWEYGVVDVWDGDFDVGVGVDGVGVVEEVEGDVVCVVGDV